MPDHVDAASSDQARMGLRGIIGLACSIAGVLAICGVLYLREASQHEQTLQDREKARIGALAHLFQIELRAAANDVRALADSDSLRSFFVSGDTSTLDRAVRRAVFTSKQQPVYDQVRFIDDAGQEIFRVNQGGRVVPRAQLQSKADRSYLQNARSLAPGQVLISAFDLNVENGRIEQPFKPTVRLIAPVFDNAGARRGSYVINYLGRGLIDPLAKAAPLVAHRLRLLNAQGYWLKAAEPEQEWGFVIPGRESLSLARTDPELWSHVGSEPDGQLQYRGGLFTWHRIYPRNFAGENSAVAEDEFLLIGSEVSAAEWNALFVRVREIFLVIAPCLVALVVISAWYIRAHRRTVLALRQSEESLAVTLQSIGDAVLATDTVGRITRINQVGETLTGWSLAEAKGRPVGEVFTILDEASRTPATALVDGVLATGKTRTQTKDTVLVARDGAERSIAASAAPIRDRAGLVLGVVLVFRDVTAERASRKKLATALKDLAREQARLKRVFDSVPVGISFAIAHLDGRRTWLINEAHLEICELSRQQLDEPHIFKRITHPDDREPQARLHSQLDAGTIGHYTMDKRYLRRDGRVVWVMLSFQRQTFSDGSQEDLSIVVDITERKQIEERVNRQNAQLRALFESLPGLYLVLRPDLTIVTATDAYLKSAMTNRAAIIGRNLFDVFPDDPDDAAANGVANLRSSLDRVLRTCAPDTMAIQKYGVKRPDGVFEERYWSPINSPMVGVDGRVEYIIHRVEDVTDFVRQKPGAEHDAGLRNRMEQMEAEVFQSSRKVQFANEQLRAAIAELESFSYSVSHDLRAPLRHIHGYVEMLRRETNGGLSETAQRYLTTITDVSREMGELIDNLLAFSRMGRVELREATVDLGALVREVLRDLELSSNKRNIEWTIANLPPVKGDLAMLKQVFTNLLDNAVKYTRQRDPALIEVGCAGEENGRIVVFVRDNGAGFDMKYAAKLFGVFQRLHHAGEFEGNGIGLASVRRIISRHGGRTWGEGEPDGGATFFVTLKVAPEFLIN